MAHVRLTSRVSPRLLAAVLSGMLHVGLYVVLALGGGRSDGMDEAETAVTQLVRIQAREPNRREGSEAPPLRPPAPAVDLPQLASSRFAPPAALDIGAFEPEQRVAVVPSPIELVEAIDTSLTAAVSPAVTVKLSAKETSAVVQQLARSAEALADAARTQVTWTEHDKQYNAVLVLERAQDGSALDRVIAEVSTDDRGRQLTTRIKLKRLAFSHFAQMVDRWDPMVQLHDDEIHGRSHINSRFNLMYDRCTAPKFLGKVTTAARSFNSESFGGRRDADIFRGGIQTRAGRIGFPEQVQPFAWAPRDDNALVHECANDTRIRFLADGSYTWHDIDTGAEHSAQPSDRPVYFMAARRATLYVKGVVTGSVLIYSPQRIVIEGNLTYARDPRVHDDSRDYLGIVSDRYVVLAPARVTGPGDIDIHAAIFARRSFIVRDIEYPRRATLRIYGSLTAGTLSATEPRYATKLEYDRRFEERRPPGFPSTDRFALEEWDGLWTEVSERAADAGED